jgi:crotonobetainyl-CoA:carnitine CoA-transferase CaiB-like acyl-CoA transferase
MQTMLSGIQVLDLSRMLPGPYCSMLLADMGADVIKVESPLLGDLLRRAPPLVGGESCYFMSVNCNKRSLALNLKRKEGREVFSRLARQADVLIEGFQPGQAERMGIGYQEMRTANPNLVYCSISGYGQDGPYADRAGHNVNYVALAGMLDLIYPPHQPPAIPGLQSADIGGALFATIGILAALVARTESGAGAYIDASLFHSAVAMTTFSAATLMTADAPNERRQKHLSGECPGYNIYRTKDGRYVAMGALETVWWVDFCHAVGRPDLAAKQVPVESERAAVLAEMQDLFAQRTQAEWVAFFADKNVCCEPVNTLEEALSHPAVTEREMIWPVDHPTAGRLRQIGLPLKGAAQSQPRLTPPPLLGQHTVEILCTLGYDAAAIAQLREKRVVSTPEDVQGREGRRNSKRD